MFEHEHQQRAINVNITHKHTHNDNDNAFFQQIFIFPLPRQPRVVVEEFKWTRIHV